jgi:hypothetical protein
VWRDFDRLRSNLIPYPFPKPCSSFHTAKLDRAHSSIKRVFLVTTMISINLHAETARTSTLGPASARGSRLVNQHRPSIGVALARRRKGQPGRVIAIADKAQQRLCRRFRKLAAGHKPAPKIAVAIARELAGFLWGALQPEPVPVK